MYERVVRVHLTLDGCVDIRFFLGLHVYSKKMFNSYHEKMESIFYFIP